ncbi:hypothetical protein AWW71_04860 [Bacillus cereus]|uniref:Uncharacterized protein n=2 Tax=root TaxID=1 RepID=A0A1B1P7D3_9CAUD|nr:MULTISPECIES: hypothetical protein [Bacillus cereus group]YP_009830718.1 hypothetical protein HWA95_gp64 [Bacillus phage vB_BtS_BMBtp14]ANT40024.1 hypothetical protein BMBtpLA2_64 [Bacillus phage vB_BtS_BMBtp14]EEM55836.1 hypothetical protein bthur0007_62960 [Bacillus thuringiensis serovar monterrey BGSC 4AJ1]KWU68432.1 hypothetical protein AWW71_04860 [Bacillus cereus]KWW50428.1 hypothetical protein AWW69_01735 [Bacillus cereus]MEB9673634.1 hypothetical protein [Bacillus anthracis]
MSSYVNPVPHVRRLLEQHGMKCYGNKFPDDAEYPCVCIRLAGGNGYTRLQLIARSENDDIEAMNLAIQAMNTMERFISDVRGLQGVWCERTSNPVPFTDKEANKEEAWCYMNLEHLGS